MQVKYDSLVHNSIASTDALLSRTSAVAKLNDFLLTQARHTTVNAVELHISWANLSRRHVTPHKIHS